MIVMNSVDLNTIMAPSNTIIVGVASPLKNIVYFQPFLIGRDWLLWRSWNLLCKTWISLMTMGKKWNWSGPLSMKQLLNQFKTWLKNKVVYWRRILCFYWAESCWTAQKILRSCSVEVHLLWTKKILSGNQDLTTVIGNGTSNTHEMISSLVVRAFTYHSMGKKDQAILDLNRLFYLVEPESYQDARLLRADS